MTAQATMERTAPAPLDPLAAEAPVIPAYLDDIAPDPAQPRLDADDDLKESIRANGVLQAILVRRHPDGTTAQWMIVDGERRWRGAKAAGLETIPVRVRSDADDEARRLILQSVANTGKPLTAIEEAKAWKRVQQLTGMNIAQLTRELGRSKSTVSDRLALADAPEVFQELFAVGALTAAAAPIIRKYATLPPKMLTLAVAQARDYYQWRNGIDNGQPISLGAVESVLKSVVIGEAYSPGLVREIPRVLAPLYKGNKVTIGKTEYATEIKAFEAAQRTYEQEQEKLAKATGVAKGEKPTPEKEDRWQRQYRLQQERFRREESKRRAESVRFSKAKLKILEAFAAAIKKAPTGISTNGKSAIAELVLKECAGQGATKDVLALLPPGTNAESILRHCAFLCIVDVAAQSYLREHHMPQLAKRFGVDLKRIIDQAAPVKKPAAKKASKAKKGR